jgi:F-type H+-transporting ATPase subunit delta
MAEKATIARPYAKAAFQYAREHNAFDRWSQVLATGAAVVADERAAPLLTNPRVKPEDLVALIADVCGGALDEHGRNFLLTLATNRRLALLPNIAKMFETLRAEVENVLDVQLVSAVQLDEAQRARMSEALKKRFKREIRLHCSIDPALIGGAIVRAGDFVIDGSLKARLERLTSAVTL